jgi:predicted RNA binding protein YcfA (HicA-like mRNA interferase family)
MTPKEVIRLLKDDGWQELKGKRTSHRQFKHPLKSGKVTVPAHPKDIEFETLKRIAAQASISLKEGGKK